jgi:uncharacterized Zn finger protein
VTTVVHPRLAPRRGGGRATTWWGRAWVRAVEEAAYADDELAAGRALARGGHVGAIGVAEGRYAATVDDRDVPFTVEGSVPVLPAADLDAFVEVVAAEAGRVAALLAGELPHQLVEHAEEAGVELLPYGGELGSSCGCAHWTDPCVHALAVLQQLAWLVDRDPLVLLHLRGLPREQLLSRLEGLRAAGGDREDGCDPALELDLDLAVEAALQAARLLADADHDADHDREAGTEADAATP